MYQENVKLLRSWVAGYTENANSVAFHNVLEKARTALPASCEDIDGVTVSRALRAAGFNRDHDAADQNVITYKRVTAR